MCSSFGIIDKYIFYIMYDCHKTIDPNNYANIQGADNFLRRSIIDLNKAADYYIH